MLVHTYGRPSVSTGTSSAGPVPMQRRDDGTWLYALPGEMLVVAGGDRVVCHTCGDALEAVTRHHRRRHELDLDGYRKRFGLNRKQSLIAPGVAEVRREEGRRRWESNDAVWDGQALGQRMSKSGELHVIGMAAQPPGSRRPEGRRLAPRGEAAPALATARVAQAAQARQRWEARAREYGFADLDAYLADRRAGGASPWKVRQELACGSAMADRLLEEGR